MSFYPPQCYLFGTKSLTQSSASFPEDKVHSLSTNEHINVENDGEVKTQ
jgi:hypothetical protein